MTVTTESTTLEPGPMGQLHALGQRNMEAMMASAAAAAHGAQAMSAHASRFSGECLKQQAQAAQALLAAKSLEEAVRLQTDYAKTMLDTYLAGMSRMSETASATARRCLAPLNTADPAARPSEGPAASADN